MGRPPWCDKVAVKKGPWTPEEDVKLASYIHEHGPGNWRAVPSNIGLMRCSKSCRLRWTNYLRPGIKHGKFSHKEDKLIIELQALLGNRWAAIASYMPQRTDADIKNNWNTNLKKRLTGSSRGDDEKGLWERLLQTDLHTARQALHETLSLASTTVIMSMPSAPAPVTYASSLENISRLLKGWMRPVGVGGSRDMAPETKQPKRTPDWKVLEPPSMLTAPGSMAYPSSAENNGCLLEGWMSPVRIEGIYGNEPAMTQQQPQCYSDGVWSTLVSHTGGTAPPAALAQAS